MKFSYNWLQTYFDTPLPKPAVLADEITFHSSEIEEIIPFGDDTVLDVKVLPDKSAWLMSHRGLAKELSVLLGLKVKQDLFESYETLTDGGKEIKVELASPTCDFYGAALVEGVKVGPSPEWLKARLEAVGQRSINNIVDATNYVMFELGQPLHAFDAAAFGSAPYIKVRQAETGEKFVTLSREELTLTENDAVITDGNSLKSLALAGVKGGLEAGVTEATTTLLLEAAHFERKAVRLTARRHKLQTDAAKRYENGLSHLVAPIALKRVAELIVEIAGGEVVGVKQSGNREHTVVPVSVALSKINSLLGLTLSSSDVSDILDRFAYKYEWSGEEVLVTPPFERDDLVIAEDVVEEIGRMHGLDKVVSIPPVVAPLKEYNARHFYAEKIRTALCGLGFSEIYTSSFRDKDLVKLENALATDKGYLRSTLINNLATAKAQNIPHRDLLGLKAVKIFEIGTVFGPESEEFRVGLAVQSGTAYKAKVDDPLMTEALEAIKVACGVEPEVLANNEGVLEFSLEAILAKAEPVTAYEAVAKTPEIIYRAFSNYPAVSRDVALWVPEGVTPETVEGLLKSIATDLCVRITHLDTFSKEGRTSLAFRLVFQASDRTLTDAQIEPIMTTVYAAITEAGFEAR